jgi:hypothetical protein
MNCPGLAELSAARSSHRLSLPQRTSASSELFLDSIQSSGRMVAQPSATQIWGYFWVGGDPPATREDVQNDLRKCLDEWFGDDAPTDTNSVSSLRWARISEHRAFALWLF